ncbi:MAG: phosphoribosylanthranilate isomerase [Trueperaceae bacterium]
MLVKICGITSPRDAEAAERAGADAIGLMFVSESARYIDTDRAREIAGAVGPSVRTVGVFRNAPLERVLDAAAELRLDAVQLHGDEDDAYLARVRASLPVIRALSFHPGLGRTRVEAIEADAVLLDGLVPGSGESFDWRLASELRGFSRLVLAGGLHPGNVAAGIEALDPYGVDVSSGVESSQGVKDHDLLRKFVQAARPGSRKSTSR